MGDDTNQSYLPPTVAQAAGAEELTMDVHGEAAMAPDAADPWYHPGTNLGTVSDINFFETALENKVANRTYIIPIMIVIGALLCGACLVVGYFYKDDIMAYVTGTPNEEIALFDSEVASSKIQSKPVPQPQIDEIAEPETLTEGDFGNVTSDFKLPDYSPTRQITESEKEMYLGLLENQYTYQRYRAAKELRTLRLGGSEGLLTKALEEPKFWTRMEAIFGLAEMGADIRSEHVKKAIGNPRPYMMREYFKRFLKNSTEGERYVLALAMYFVNPDAQEVIGTALAPYRTVQTSSIDL